MSEPKKLEFCLWVLGRTTTAEGATARDGVKYTCVGLEIPSGVRRVVAEGQSSFWTETVLRESNELPALLFKAQ